MLLIDDGLKKINLKQMQLAIHRNQGSLG